MLVIGDRLLGDAQSRGGVFVGSPLHEQQFQALEAFPFPFLDPADDEPLEAVRDDRFLTRFAFPAAGQTGGDAGATFRLRPRTARRCPPSAAALGAGLHAAARP